MTLNKYFGLYELKSISIPTVPWRIFTRETELDPGLLWTVRVAVEDNKDLNLPRIVGSKSDEAVRMGRKFLDKFSSRGIVLFYPYFIAEKSGVLEIGGNRTVIEAVDKDLWNLVTYGRKNVTIILSYKQNMENSQYIGDASFLCDEDLCELKEYASVIKGRFRDELSEGKSILAEWSYAYNTDISHQSIGAKYLVFYELRSV
jgi:hypothetical protein